MYVLASVTNPIPTSISTTVIEHRLPSHHHFLSQRPLHPRQHLHTALLVHTSITQLGLATTTQSFPEHLFSTHCVHGHSALHDSSHFCIPWLSFARFLLVAVCVCVYELTLTPSK